MLIGLGCLISWITTISVSVLLFNPNLNRIAKRRTYELTETIKNFMPVRKEIEYVTVKEIVKVPVKEFV